MEVVATAIAIARDVFEEKPYLLKRQTNDRPLRFFNVYELTTTSIDASFPPIYPFSVAIF